MTDIQNFKSSGKTRNEKKLTLVTMWPLNLPKIPWHTSSSLPSTDLYAFLARKKNKLSREAGYKLRLRQSFDSDSDKRQETNGKEVGKNSDIWC